jgi:hypothetical protein
MVAKKKTPNFLGNLKEGTLHKALGYKENVTLPKSTVDKVVNSKPGTKVEAKGKTVKVTPKMKKKAQFAVNARTWSPSKK